MLYQHKKTGSRVKKISELDNGDYFMVEDQDGKVFVCDNVLEAIKGADAVLILTEWEEFKYLDWNKIYSQMRKPAWIFDARSIVNANLIKKTDLNFWRIGDGSEMR